MQRTTTKKVNGCCFCNGPGLTKEHIWPDWAADLLPDSGSYFRAKIRGGGGLSPGGSVEGHWSRQGAVKTIRLRVVCKPCNSGWMGDMEQAVKPILKPMLNDKQISLSRDNQQTLAQYFAMKAMVADLSRPPYAFTENERNLFYLERAIPDRCRIHLSRYPDPPNPIVALYNKESVGGIGLNQTFRFNYIYVQVLMPVVKILKKLPKSHWITINPVDDEVIWPPNQSIFIQEAKEFQHIFERIYLGKPHQ